MHRAYKIIFIIIFSTLISNLFGEEKNNSKLKYLITYNEYQKSIDFDLTLALSFDENGKVKLTYPKSSNIKIKSVLANIDGEASKLDSVKKSRGSIILKNELYKNKNIKINIKYRVKMLLKQPFLLLRNFLFFPSDFFQVNNKNQNIQYDYEIVLNIPEKWEILSPINIKKHSVSNDKKTFTEIKIETKTPPVFLIGKNIKPLLQVKLEDKNYTIYGRKFLERFFKNKEQNKKIINNLELLRKYTEKQLNKKIEINELNFLLVGLINTSLEVGDSFIISPFHLLSLLKEKEAVEIYDIIHDLALKISAPKINPSRLYNDYWIAEGIAHTTANNYFNEKYGLTLNYANSNPFINFLLGKKRSRYAQTSGMFSDFTRYKAVKTVAKNNKPKYIAYNNRASTINTNYSVQVFHNLKNLIGSDKFNNFVRSILNDDNYITTKTFLSKIKKEFGDEEYQIIENIVYLYPEIDYKVLKKKGKIIILRKKGSITLPVEIEIIDKQKNRERKVVLMNKNKIQLELDAKNIRNVIIDPDDLINETNESNNFLIRPFNFSILSPMKRMNTYNMALSGVLCDYNDVMMGGASIAGGWNLASFTPNSLNKPALLWGLDIGYGYDDKGNLKNINNLFINLFFESPIYPRSVWSPRFYTYYFFVTGESMSAKTGLQGFLPPVIDTEYDRIHFNHSWDTGFDFKLTYYPYKSIDFNFNAGYRAYFKCGFLNLEGIIALNLDFDKAAPKDINLGCHLDTKFDFNIIEIGIRPGILKSFFPYTRYEFTRPKFTRFSLVSQSIGYYESITKNLVYAKNLILDFPYPIMDFFFLSASLLFKIHILKEPLLDPMVTLGLGPFCDLTLPIPIAPNRVKALFVGAEIKLDIMKKISVIIRGTFLPIYSINGMPGLRMVSPLALFFYEIRAYL